MDRKLLEKIELINSYKIISDWKEFKLIDELKKIPRAGKHLRLDKAWIVLPKRSVYDHLLSLWRNVNIFKDFIDFEISEEKVSNIIAFHDLAEAIMWDIPFFTSTELAKWLYKSKEHKDEEEKRVNNLILNTFEWELKRDFSEYLSDCESWEFSNELKYFNYLDRIDPVLNIWKYLLIFKSKIDIEVFLEAMNDFFINPNLVNYTLNNDTLTVVKFLQNKDFAIDFFYNWVSSFDSNLDLSKSKIDLFKSIFDTEEMFFI